MLGAGIVDRRLRVRSRQQDTAEVGEIVIALLGEDATGQTAAQTREGVGLEVASESGLCAYTVLTHLTVPPPRILGKVGRRLSSLWNHHGQP